MIKPTQALIGHIYADVITRQIPSEPLNVTEHPIENGSIIAEHVSEGEKTLTLDCTFADDVYSIIVGAGVAAVTETTADDKRDAVYKLKRDKRIIDINTMKDTYQSMLLIDINEEITPQNSKAFVATLYFKQVQLVESITSNVPLDRIKKKSPSKKEAALKQTPTADQGTQSTEDSGEDPEIASAVDDVFGALGA